MSMSSSFGYSNKTAMSNTVTPINIGPVTNYAKTEDTATSCSLSNKTCALDQMEKLSYQCTQIGNVSTKNTIQHPSPVREGVQYIVRLDEVLRTVDSAGSIVCDEPVVAYLTIRHQASGNISNALVTEVVTRLLGACMRADGTYRFDDLMRSALVPVQN